MRTVFIDGKEYRQIGKYVTSGWGHSNDKEFYHMFFDYDNGDEDPAYDMRIDLVHTNNGWELGFSDVLYKVYRIFYPVSKREIYYTWSGRNQPVFDSLEEAIDHVNKFIDKWDKLNAFI